MQMVTAITVSMPVFSKVLFQFLHPFLTPDALFPKFWITLTMKFKHIKSMVKANRLKEVMNQANDRESLKAMCMKAIAQKNRPSIMAKKSSWNNKNWLEMLMVRIKKTNAKIPKINATIPSYMNLSKQCCLK